MNLRSFSLAVLLAGAGASAAAGQVISTFDTGLDGWTLATNDPASTLTFFATGGNPGGFIQFSDGAQGSDDVFSAPAKFLGNDAGYLNGTLSFDLARNQQAENIGFTPLVITSGSGDNLSLILAAPATSSNPLVWTSYNLALNPSTGFVFDGGTTNSLEWVASGGTPATLGQINAVLGNVASIYVPADMHNGTELTSLDNFALTAAVPEPASWGILAGGMVAWCAVRRRRVNSKSI